MSELSVVIITYNNYSLKNGCIESVLLALDSQSDVHFDVAVVDNHSSSEDYEMLKDFVSDICFRFDLCLLRNSCNNISKGRNMGVHHTQGDTILFLDDDMLLLEKDILYQVLLLSKEKEYGCAAIREWTPKGWYDNNKHVLESYFLRWISLNLSVRNWTPRWISFYWIPLIPVSLISGMMNLARLWNAAIQVH